MLSFRFLGSWRVVLCLLVAVAFTAAPAQEFIHEATPLSIPRQMHGSAVLGNYLYVIGGASGGSPTLSVERSPIGPDGSLGAWESSQPLPEPRLYTGSSTLSLERHIYVLGGSAAILSPTTYNTMLYAAHGTDGKLGPWQKSPAFPSGGVNAAAAVATPGYIHLIGGLDSKDQPTASVFSLELDSAGQPMEWISSETLPTSLWYHHAATATGRVYVWGGLTRLKSDSATAQVYSAPVLASGRIGPWRQEANRIPRPGYAASVAVAGPYLISLSPRLAGATESNEIWWGTAGLEGVTPWQALQTNIQAKIYHASAQDYPRGLVYLTGGRASSKDVTTILSKVYVIKLSSEARDQAYASLQDISRAAGRRIGETGAARSSSTSGVSFSRELTLPNATMTEFLMKFQPYEAVRGSARPMLVYYHLPAASPCQEQSTTLSTEGLVAGAGGVAIAHVNVGESSQTGQNHGVWRVPTWILFDAAGYEVARHDGVAEEADIRAMTAKSAPR